MYRWNTEADRSSLPLDARLSCGALIQRVLTGRIDENLLEKNISIVKNNSGSRGPPYRGPQRAFDGSSLCFKESSLRPSGG